MKERFGMNNPSTNNSYHLAKKPGGSHYERFVSLDDADAVAEAITQACDGTLDGNTPASNRRYRPSVYHGYGQGRILIKLMTT